jgi:hypothetical protein
VTLKPLRTGAVAMNRSIPLHTLAPFILAAAMTLLCYSAAGASAGTYFGGVAFAVLITPAFVAAEDSPRDRLTVAAAVFAGVALAWLFPLRDPYVTLRHWAAAVAVLAGVIAAVFGVVVALRTARLPAAFAAALTTLLFALWLTWPIWLSPHLAGRTTLTHTLAFAHPLFAIEHALSDLGPPWTERPLMYNELSVLNQDVSYSLPSTIAWSFLVHSLIGGVGWSAGWLASRREAPLNERFPSPTLNA